MLRKCALAGTAVAALTLLIGAVAAEKLVTLKDGTKLTGQVEKTADGLRIRTRSGVVVVVGADSVADIKDVKTPESELKERLAAAGDKDPDKLYEVARWAADNDLLVEARTILKKVLALKEDHENAKLLLRLVDSSLAMTTRPATPVEEAGKGIFLKPSMLLTREDVYRIRLYELRRGDKVAIEFRDKALDRFIESMRGVGIFAEPDGERRFRAVPRVDQARYILGNTNRESKIRQDILIKTDPKVMSTFRSRIWPIVAKGCASSLCHGGTKGAGRLVFFNVPLRDDRIAYTNFFILQGWEVQGRKLIKRDNPEMSLLLQYGLPPKLARLPHPGPMEPLFRSTQDRTYRTILDWIRSLRYPLPGEYGVKYRIPGLPVEPPSTQPKLFD